MNNPSYAQVVGNLRRASMPLRELGGLGHVAVILAAGRLVAMSFSADSPNLLWSNPSLADSGTVREHPERLTGGFGGDRLLFSPELSFHWVGKPNWQTFENYKTQAAMDPGAYEFVGLDEDSIELRASGELVDYNASHTVGFAVSRRFRTVDPPISSSDPLMKAVDYVGVDESHVLRVAHQTGDGVIDLWHLLQVPAGSVLIVPIKPSLAGQRERPVSYGLTGAWVEKPDHIMWRYGGTAQAKLGVSAQSLTGRSAVFRELQPGRWCMIVRDFPVSPNERYGDHPYAQPRDDQAFQAWDGFGFGEMEYHSSLLDAKSGPRELQETNRLWAFGGSASSIGAIAFRLLGVDVGYVLK